MSEFIVVEIASERCLGINKCGQCVQVCPVGIFGKREDRPLIVDENQDECTLCDLCLVACKPDAIDIIKRYED